MFAYSHVLYTCIFVSVCMCNYTLPPVIIRQLMELFFLRSAVNFQSGVRTTGAGIYTGKNVANEFLSRLPCYC